MIGIYIHNKKKQITLENKKKVNKKSKNKKKK